MRWMLHILLVMALLGVSGTALAEPVQVRAATNAQGGRIALIWQSPVAYEASLTGSELTLSFGRTIDADLSVITGNIPGFVTGVDRNADGTQLRLSLTGTYDLIHFPTGGTIVIDLVGPPGGGAVETATDTTPEAASESVAEPETEQQASSESTSSEVEQVAQETQQPETQQPATQSLDEGPTVDTSSLPQVGVRTGLHADKLRVVFDWDQEVPYTVQRDGGVATVTFSRAVGMDVGRLLGVEPNVLGDARHRATAQSSIVELAVAEGAAIRDFYAGTKVVLDVVFPTDGSRAGRLPATTSISPTPDPEPVVEEETTTDVAAEVSEPQPTTEETSEASATTSEIAEDVGTVEQPTDLTTPDGEAEVAGNAASAQGTSAAPQGVIESGASANDSGFVMRFDWDEPVAASVFRRGSALWIVFDKPAAIDIESMRAVAGDQLLELAQLQHPAATVLRAVTAQGINPVPKREGLAWLFEFSRQSLSTLSPVEAAAQPDSPVGARVFLPVPEPGKAVALVDPEMGDNFVTIPLIPLGYGVTHLYEYPQFRIRPSSQGLVIEPRVDTLRIRPSRQGVGITSTRLLQISPVTDLDSARARADSDRPLSRIVDFESLQNVTVEFFNQRRQEFEYAIALAPSRSKRAEGRFELARFFLAHGYAAEALGVLRVLADEVPAEKKRADYRLYRGIANYLMGWYDEAKEDLKGSQLDNNDEGLFWRALIEFVQGNEEAAVMRGLRSTGRIPDPYPNALRIPLTMRVIEASIRVGDSDRAQELVDTLNAEELNAKERGEWQYLSGLYNESAGDFDAAIFDFEQAMSGGHRPSRVFATQARAELERELERASVIQTIDQLETLRFAWRGGDFEFRLLRRLGDLYLSQGGYRQGLTTLRQAATHFRENEGAEQITQRMSDTFAYLFLKNGADRLPPVTAIALYEEFKELTPAGELGDQMIRKLADRLVNVDLLDEASTLLDGQIKFRLQGVEKARVGAQLAVVRLLARDYVGAIKSLDLSDESGQPEELLLQRRHLRSRALAGVGEMVNALALLEDDESLEAEQLRAEEYWAIQDWTRAAQALRRLLILNGVEANQPLSPEQALSVLNYTIALTLSGNDRGLATIRQKYGTAMAATDLKDAFILIATPEQFGLISADSIPSKIHLAENFQTFLTAYKQRLEEHALSEIN